MPRASHDFHSFISDIVLDYVSGRLDNTFFDFDVVRYIQRRFDLDFDDESLVREILEELENDGVIAETEDGYIDSSYLTAAPQQGTSYDFLLGTYY